MVRSIPVPILLVLAASCKLPAQSFDVASIKLRAGEVNFSQDPTIRGRRVVGTASTLQDLITYAYGVRYDQIVGAPEWSAPIITIWRPNPRVRAC